MARAGGGPARARRVDESRFAGMAFGPPEIEPDTTSVRKTALAHALLPSTFATGILGWR
jgi:hypothetical protein